MKMVEGIPRDYAVFHWEENGEIKLLIIDRGEDFIVQLESKPPRLYRWDDPDFKRRLKQAVDLVVNNKL